MISYYINGCPVFWEVTADSEGAEFGPFDSFQEAQEFLEKYQELIETCSKDELPPDLEAKFLPLQ